MTVRRRHIPTRCAATLAVVLGILAAAPAAPAQTTGGSEARTSFLDVRPASLAQRTLRIAGTVGADDAGRTVRIERQSADGRWDEVATATADADGAFVAHWLTDTPGRYALRAAAERSAGATTASAPEELFARISLFAPATASWYGPGFFGRRTACGTRLTRRTVGVAHKTLPCGTKVEIYHRNRTIVVPVIDRGPFVAGRQWDLTQAAARAIGMRGTSRVGVLPAS
jgi:rare lipoprotein A (peptidoglycan hydrolase)